MKIKAVLVLTLVAIIWGGTFPFMKASMAHVDPVAFVFWRFSLAALVFLPFVLWNVRSIDKPMLRHALVLGLMNGALQVFQCMGIRQETSANAALIMGSYVILVPLLMPFFRLGRPKGVDLWSPFLCLLGLFILKGMDFGGMQWGDGWLFLSALTLAGSINYLQIASRDTQHLTLFASLQIIFILPCVMALAPTLDVQALKIPSVAMALLYCGLLASCLTFVLQTHYQRCMSPHEAALIYALEPVFSAIFGFFFNHESLGTYGILGGAVILTSLMLPPLVRLKSEKKGIPHASDHA